MRWSKMRWSKWDHDENIFSCIAKCYNRSCNLFLFWFFFSFFFWGGLRSRHTFFLLLCPMSPTASPPLSSGVYTLDISHTPSNTLKYYCPSVSIVYMPALSGGGALKILIIFSYGISSFFLRLCSSIINANILHYTSMILKEYCVQMALVVKAIIV